MGNARTGSAAGRGLLLLAAAALAGCPGLSPYVDLTESEARMFAAAFNGNHAEVRAMVESGVNVNVQARDGNTVLHQLVEYSPEPAMVRLLLDSGSDVRIRDKMGRTPLHWAADAEQVEIHELLVDAGSEVDARDVFGQTPLHFMAGSNPNVDALRYLVGRGAAVDIPNEINATPLHLAANTNKNPDVIRFLVGEGARLESRDVELDGTPLHWAANANVNPAVVGALLDAGADPCARSSRWGLPIDAAEGNRFIRDSGEVARLRAASEGC